MPKLSQNPHEYVVFSLSQIEPFSRATHPVSHHPSRHSHSFHTIPSNQHAKYRIFSHSFSRHITWAKNSRTIMPTKCLLIACSASTMSQLLRAGSSSHPRTIYFFLLLFCFFSRTTVVFSQLVQIVIYFVTVRHLHAFLR